LSGDLLSFLVDEHETVSEPISKALRNKRLLCAVCWFWFHVYSSLFITLWPHRTRNYHALVWRWFTCSFHAIYIIVFRWYETLPKSQSMGKGTKKSPHTTIWLYGE